MCAADCQGFESKPCAKGLHCVAGACVAQLCQPGATPNGSNVEQPQGAPAMLKPGEIVEFKLIAAADNTTVSWTPPTNTVAGAGVVAVNAGQTGKVVLNRFDTLQVRVPNGADISGTFVSGDKPIWVVGAVSCVNVPNNITYCDHIEE